jgi:shikimate dehydrogenase
VATSSAINGSLYRVGLLGAGIQLSSSPELHMTEASDLGIAYSYELFDLDLLPGGAADFADALQGAEAKGFAGLNVTFPVKQQIIPLLHDLCPEAKALHAVNTVVFQNGRRIGYNTDWWGFYESFRRGLPDAALRRVALIGAGGAGSAVAYAALKLGAESLRVFDLDVSRAQQLVERLQPVFADRQIVAAESLESALNNADGLIHATPMGMAKIPGKAVPDSLLHAGLWVAEVVYVPLETELLAAARTKGCRILNGSGMAVYQAAQAMELFTGLKPDAERMRRKFTSKLQSAEARARASSCVA